MIPGKGIFTIVSLKQLNISGYITEMGVQSALITTIKK